MLSFFFPVLFQVNEKAQARACNPLCVAWILTSVEAFLIMVCERLGSRWKGSYHASCGAFGHKSIEYQKVAILQLRTFRTC